MSRAARRVTTTLLIFSLAGSLAATELRVTPSRVRLDESVQIVLRLTDAFAGLDAPRLPLTNLVLEGQPSVSSQFQWINGVISRERTYTFSAHPSTAGKAAVGPLTLFGDEGQVVLPQVVLEVLPAVAVNPNAPSDSLNDLRASGGEQIVLSAEVSQKEAFEGEELIVTWYLYARETVRGFSVTANPSLRDFWSEEIPVDDHRATEIVVNGQPVLKIAVRSVALFPLHAGAVNIPSLELVAQVLRPIDDGFGLGGIFEGRAVDIRRRSQEVPLIVKAVPAEADGVGDFSMRCSRLPESVSGPVKVEVTLKGRGNLRSVSAPGWEKPVDGAVEIEELATKVDRSGSDVQMSRSWRFVIFPAHDGAFTLPAMRFRAFDPRTGQINTLVCGGGVTTIHALSGPASSRPAQPLARTDGPGRRPWLFPAAAVTLAVVLLILLYLHRYRPASNDAALASLVALVHDPRDLRRAVYAIVSERGLRANDLFHDPSELGERFRYLLSWVELLEKEPAAAGRDSAKELRKRAAEFLSELKREK